jgi:hypothetical protein
MRAVLMVAVVALGCAEGVPLPDHSQTRELGFEMRRPERLVMPGDMPAWAVSAALEASDLWCAAAGWCPELVAGEPAGGDWGLGMHALPGTIAGTILYEEQWIFVDDRSERCPVAVIAHELGHSAGLIEHQDTGLMATNGCPEPEIDALTLGRFCELWDC